MKVAIDTEKLHEMQDEIKKLKNQAVITEKCNCDKEIIALKEELIDTKKHALNLQKEKSIAEKNMTIIVDENKKVKKERNELRIELQRFEKEEAKEDAEKESII